ncbi:MAG: PEP-CTERM sorting domain-containing protein [Lentisphaeria bacterium]|nr:PEP-CTERM sorting domain-containing protein [Lentisphaeria bacterium]
MNIRKLFTFSTAFLAIAFFAAGSAKAETIVVTSGATIVSTDFSDAGFTKSGNTASGFTWDDVTGVTAPATSLSVFDNATDAALSFFDVRANQMDVNENIGGGGTWRSSFNLVLDGSTSYIDLTSFDLVIDLTTGTGGNQANTSNKDGIWTVNIVGSGSYNGTASVTIGNYTSVTGQAVSVDLSSLPNLTNAETYTFTFDVIADASDTDWGHNISVDSLSLTGDVATVIPEPSTMILAGLGLLGVTFRRRRRA